MIISVLILGALLALQASGREQSDPSALRSEAAPTVVLAGVQGNVWIDRSPDLEPVAAAIGMRLQAGDRVRTEAEASAMIYFTGGHMVRVHGGNSLEVARDPGGPSPDSTHVNAMSGESLEVLEEGLMVLTDPRGSLLLGTARGGAGASADMALSPRKEMITARSPVFYWSSREPDPRIIVSHGADVIWKSGKISGSMLSYPEDAPRLEAGQTYRWWLESAEMQEPLNEPVPFRTPTAAQIEQMSRFEAEVCLLSADAHAEAADFLRSAFYERLGAWSRVLHISNGLARLQASAGYAEQLSRLAGRRMGIKQRHVEALLDLRDEAGSGSGQPCGIAAR